MSEKILKIEYECLQSCVVFCKKGELFLPESEFARLSSVYKHVPEGFNQGEGTLFKSPMGACRMGFSQQFKALNIVAAAENENAETRGPEGKDLGNFIDLGRRFVLKETGGPEGKDIDNGPIGALIAEHKKVMEKIEKVEEHLIKRDIEGLWVSTADLDNIVHLHGGIKEEEILFPALRGIVPFGEGLVACIYEDHREIVSLLYSFREALKDGNINDKIIDSSLVALKSHIRKEDNEFFEFIRKYISDEMKQAIMAKMELADKTFTPEEPGERKFNEKEAAERAKFHARTIETREIACDTCCH